ncbi:hypothetical protein DM02DRAFT_372956 [Periconia macrospinosa]|uniref:Uncharacterized protein n=1 Tax=Periconia macrospinosa TaxID=97972 RepID=A0A2V1D0R6_9PLEO|nr:hypothetical protein DM02DRAFT_372956 [Periconia macrospinosa]
MKRNGMRLTGCVEVQTDRQGQPAEQDKGQGQGQGEDNQSNPSNHSLSGAKPASGREGKKGERKKGNSLSHYFRLAPSPLQHNTIHQSLYLTYHSFTLLNLPLIHLIHSPQYLISASKCQLADSTHPA